MGGGMGQVLRFSNSVADYIPKIFTSLKIKVSSRDVIMNNHHLAS